MDPNHGSKPPALRGRRLTPIPFLALLPLGAVFFCFLAPYGTALGMVSRGPVGPENPLLLPVTLFTLKQAVWSTLLALALGLPGAWFLASGEGRAAAFLRSLTVIPFAMPSILVVLGFVLFFGNAGWANRLWMNLTGAESGPLRILYKPEAIVLAHGFYNFPLVVRLGGDGIAQARKAYSSAAMVLGASPLKIALTILLPLALPALMSALLLVFLYSFTSFALVLVLGGGPSATTLAVEIYRYARLSLNYPAAAQLAILETLMTALVFVCWLWIQRKGRTGTAGEPRVEIRDRPLEIRRFSLLALTGTLLYGGVLILLVLGPLLSIPLESLLSRSSRGGAPELSLRWWRSLGETVLPAWGHSLVLALGSATAATGLAIIAAATARQAGKPLALLLRIGNTAPLASSGIVLGFGWLALYGRTSVRSPLVVIILHGVTALPFAYSSIAAGLAAIPPDTPNAARVFGASPLTALLTVELPLAARHIRSAWAFAAALSLGELNAILMIGLENWETLPLLIYRAVSSYRYGTACAAGTLLILCCVGALWFSEIGRGRENRRFRYGP